VAKLDRMRKDFVANVSHELKTPITAIKGYIETVLEIKPLEEAKARRFLEIAARQADRLNAIVDDLLKLAEIEQRAENAQIELVKSPIRPVIDAAAGNCEPIAVERGIQIQTDCPEDLTAVINPPLLERAVANLIDNAVKYSPEGARVRVLGEQTNGEVAIHVIDNGPGIEAEHLPRIFERFYRVDTARSRKLGGTGLGLAIVKHVAQAHGGRVEVESTPGQGSKFTIVLPA
ncbi:MAG: sensor histidine kinase, partial [Armatimonadota bacterium]